MVPLGLPEADASGPGFLSGAREQSIEPSTSPAVLIARLLRARHMDQCNGRLTASSHRDTLAPHKVQQCKLPSSLAVDNLDASLSVRSLLISRRSKASAR